MDLDELESAASLYEIVAKGREVALGSDHPDTIDSLHIALIHVHCGRHDDASTLIRKVVDEQRHAWS